MDHISLPFPAPSPENSILCLLLRHACVVSNSHPSILSSSSPQTHSHSLSLSHEFFNCWWNFIVVVMRMRWWSDMWDIKISSVMWAGEAIYIREVLCLPGNQILLLLHWMRKEKERMLRREITFSSYSFLQQASCVAAEDDSLIIHSLIIASWPSDSGCSCHPLALIVVSLFLPLFDLYDLWDHVHACLHSPRQECA